MKSIKRHFIKILVAVVSTLIVSGVGAVIGVYINDKVQDSKIDIIAKDVALIKLYLMGK